MALITLDLQDTFATLKNRFNELSSNVGDITNLTTARDSDLVVAINSIESDLSALTSNVDSRIGDLDLLDSDLADSDLVFAINSLYDYTNSLVGVLANLRAGITQTNLVAAINSVDSDLDFLRLRVDAIDSDIGDLNNIDSELSKSDLVSAINSLNDRFLDVYDSAGIKLNT